MAVYAGYGGSIKYQATAVGEIGEWSLNIDREALDDTAFGDTWKSATPGIGAWTGSLTGRFDPANAGQLAMMNAIIGGTAGAQALLFSHNGTNGFTAALGTWLVTSFAPKASVDGLVEVSIEIQGIGAISYS